MCGIIACLVTDGRGVSPELLSRMNALHRLRGPDYGEEVVLDEGRIGLAHSRLAIIDLSENANQPMSTEDGRHWLVFNGEIYNFRELREQLEGLGEHFRSSSDTEVLLLALRRWEAGALERIEGIFAFVYANLDAGYILAARDRIGVKPLCYFQSANSVFFSSTISPLRLAPEFDFRIDPMGLFEMLTAKYVVAPRSIFSQLRKLEPGCWMRVDFSGRVRTGCYWSIECCLKELREESGKEESAEDYWLFRLQEAIRRAVKRQLVADTDIGVFLSGGTDSTLVAAVARELYGRINSFTIGFPVRSYDESADARRTAKILETQHNELTVTPSQVIDTLQRITTAFDEPFGDASAVPTYLVSRYAREKVKVVLSGDGGDEQFFGYPRYLTLARLHPVLKKRPDWIRPLAGLVAGKMPHSFLGHAVSAVMGFPDESSLYTHFMLDRFAVLAERAGAGPKASLWKSGLSHRNLEGYHIARSRPRRFLNGMMLADLLNYLPDDCLTKVDRASMANSLEVRVPMLDENMLRLSLAMPIDLKWRGGQGKYLLKRLLCRYVPRECVYRPKKGFGVPLDRWLFNEMKEFTMDLLSRGNLLSAGLDPEGVDGIIREHRQGRCDHQYTIWPICCYVAWHNAHSSVFSSDISVDTCIND